VANVDLPVEAIARSVQEGIAMHPMKEFDPTKPAMVHDRLNDRTFEWKPATMQANYEKYAEASEHSISHAMSVPGQTRRFGSPTITSGLSPTSDIPGPGRHFAKVP
jgi:hypothetical protein